MIIMMLVKKMKMLLLKTEMHDNIGALDIVNDKLDFHIEQAFGRHCKNLVHSFKDSD